MLEITRRRQGSGPITRVQDEMNDLFGRFLGNDWPWRQGQTSGGWWPSMDVADRDDAVVVKMDVPGMKPQDIDIAVEGSTLTISGERKDCCQSEGENYYHCERRNGTFRRDIVLPATVATDKIDAQYRDGVLTVTLPKTEQAKPRKISIKT